MHAVVHRRFFGWSLVCVAVVACWVPPPVLAGDDGAQYRRWRSSNTYSCTQTEPNVITVALDAQPIEFNNLPAGAEWTSTSINNGIVLASARYPAEQASGEIVYGNFATYFETYPLTYDFRLDTIIDGATVYRSTYSIDCDGDSEASLPVVAEQIDFGPPADRWLRWAWPNTYFCSTTPDGVELTLIDLEAELSPLPAHARFFLNSSRNGHEQRGGPFTLEQIVAQLEGLPVVELFGSYPVHYEQRIDTVVSGIVAYTSTLVASCGTAEEGLGLTADITSHGNFDLFLSDFETEPSFD